MSAPSRPALVKLTPEQLAERTLAEAIQKAIQRDLPEFMRKMLDGREPNAPEMRGAVLGLGLINDRNAADTNRRFERFERHTWIWRLFHRVPKPDKPAAP